MRKFIFGAIIVALLVSASAVAFAEGTGFPEGVQVFTVEDHTCVMSPSGDLECFCPCVACQVSANPTSESRTVITSYPTPTPYPLPTAVPTKVHCDKGEGNGGEGCGPGNHPELGNDDED